MDHECQDSLQTRFKVLNLHGIKLVRTKKVPVYIRTGKNYISNQNTIVLRFIWG